MAQWMRAGRDSLLRWWQEFVRNFDAYDMELMLGPHKVNGPNGRSGVIPWCHAAPKGGVHSRGLGLMPVLAAA
jgi:hypothetical protein